MKLTSDKALSMLKEMEKETKDITCICNSICVGNFYTRPKSFKSF